MERSEQASLIGNLWMERSETTKALALAKAKLWFYRQNAAAWVAWIDISGDPPDLAIPSREALMQVKREIADLSSHLADLEARLELLK